MNVRPPDDLRPPGAKRCWKDMIVIVYNEIVIFERNVGFWLITAL